MLSVVAIFAQHTYGSLQFNQGNRLVTARTGVFGICLLQSQLSIEDFKLGPRSGAVASDSVLKSQLGLLDRTLSGVQSLAGFVDVHPGAIDFTSDGPVQLLGLQLDPSTRLTRLSDPSA